MHGSEGSLGWQQPGLTRPVYLTNMNTVVKLRAHIDFWRDK